MTCLCFTVTLKSESNWHHVPLFLLWTDQKNPVWVKSSAIQIPTGAAQVTCCHKILQPVRGRAVEKFLPIEPPWIAHFPQTFSPSVLRASFAEDECHQGSTVLTTPTSNATWPAISSFCRVQSSQSSPKSSLKVNEEVLLITMPRSFRPWINTYLPCRK